MVSVRRNEELWTSRTWHYPWKTIQHKSTDMRENDKGWRQLQESDTDTTNLKPNSKQYDNLTFRRKRKSLTNGYSIPYRYGDTMDDAPTSLKSVYRGRLYDHSFEDFGGDSSYAVHPDEQEAKVQEEEIESGVAEVRKIPECHYETISLFKPKAAAQTSDAHHGDADDKNTFKGDYHEDPVYHSGVEDRRFTQDHEGLSQSRYVNIEFDDRGGGSDNDDDEEVDDDESIFKPIHGRESSSGIGSTDVIHSDTSQEKDEGKFQGLFEALESFNKFFENMPPNEADDGDDPTTESAGEAILSARVNSIDTSERKDGVENTGDKVAGNQEDGNTWVWATYKETQGNHSKQSGLYKAHIETTTVVLPYRVAVHMREKADGGSGISPAARVMHAGMELDPSFARLHTTTKDGITEDIIYAGSGCHYDNSEDCSVIGSGTGDEIITGVVVVTTTTTTPRPSTTARPTPPCKGHDCESSSRLRLTPGPGTTRSPKDLGSGSGSGLGKGSASGDGNGYSVNGPRGADKDGLNGHQIVDNYDEDSTAEPGKQTDKGGSSINLGLILGVLGSVLLAVIVLAIAFCKLRSRDEGTYKVDETQNFSALHSKKTQGNGAMASGSESGGKRGKKKDVKEWYV
ncbi:neurexin [Elysia marginata]|uniref:Neurexin n=1 Tax=Elysia marginata TaxID=1093978 RepID=A0AAV4EX83_9GAST|nr:neurexin [Elysia marginata]